MKVLFVEGTNNHDPRKVTSRPTGGILTSLTLIPKYLASKGHEVYVQSTYDPKDGHEIIDGVHYIIPHAEIPKWDVVVFNRNVLPRDFVFYCKEIGAKVIWWLHDIVQTTYFKDDTFRYVDHVVALSDYCKQTYCDFYSLDANKISVIPNGVDKSLFYPGNYEDRDPNIYLMASALVKGYLPIPTVFDNLKRVNPDVDFRIYSNQNLHGMNNNPQQQGFLDSMERTGAHVYSPVSPEVLAHLMRKAWCLLMPNTYPEICSNLLLQAQASGLPVVTSGIGSVPEFIEQGKTGLYTSKYSPHDLYSWIIEYTNLVFDLSNKEKHKLISGQAPKNVLSWEDIGQEWEKCLQNLTNQEPANSVVNAGNLKI